MVEDVNCDEMKWHDHMLRRHGTLMAWGHLQLSSGRQGQDEEQAAAMDVAAFDYTRAAKDDREHTQQHYMAGGHDIAAVGIAAAGNTADASAAAPMRHLVPCHSAAAAGQRQDLALAESG
jgi:hypothetical protein